MKNTLFRKVLVIGIIILFVGVSVLSSVSSANDITAVIEENKSEKMSYTSNRGVDVAILSLFIGYDYDRFKYVFIEVKNIGDVSLEYFQFVGKLHRYSYLQRKFILYDEAYAGYTPGGQWTPGKTYKLDAFYAPNSGLCKIYLNLQAKGDINTSNNIIDGYYKIKGDSIYPVNYHFGIEQYKIRFLEKFPLLQHLLEIWRYHLV